MIGMVINVPTQMTFEVTQWGQVHLLSFHLTLAAYIV